MIKLDRSKITFSYARSCGPGGQNVNKVNSKVTLFWDFAGSAGLSAEQKNLIQNHPALKKRINKMGILFLQEQGRRSRALNEARLIAKLLKILEQVLTPPRRRLKTQVPRRAVEERLRTKKRLAQRKEQRRKSFETG